MIVQPDFLDHWKTQLLQEILQDPMAPMYVLRLWAHCQNRKTHRFHRINPALTKAICKAPQDAKIFEKAMVDSGFIEIEGDEIVAHEWDTVNAYLINSWKNGKKGGRPANKTQKKPTGNPEQTHTKPIREEKRREDKINICPYQDIRDLFIAECCPPLPKISEPSKWPPALKTNVKARWNESKQNIEAFRSLFEIVAKSRFLCGYEKEWKADFQWLMKSSNWFKVSEGTYDDKPATQKPATREFRGF